MLWKSHIITLTEQASARASKIDASFFPLVSEAELTGWETAHESSIPDELRSFLAQSNGLEAQCGKVWPVLPIEKWEFIHDQCISSHPWIRFGESKEFRYLISLGHSPSIYRHATFGSDEEFFGSTFTNYLKKIFNGEG